jgi:hypothetical protein
MEITSFTYNSNDNSNVRLIPVAITSWKHDPEGSTTNKDFKKYLNFNSKYHKNLIVENNDATGFNKLLNTYSDNNKEINELLRKNIDPKLLDKVGKLRVMEGQMAREHDRMVKLNKQDGSGSCFMGKQKKISMQKNKGINPNVHNIIKGNREKLADGGKRNTKNTKVLTDIRNEEKKNRDLKGEVAIIETPNGTQLKLGFYTPRGIFKKAQKLQKKILDGDLSDDFSLGSLFNCVSNNKNKNKNDEDHDDSEKKSFFQKGFWKNLFRFNFLSENDGYNGPSVDPPRRPHTQTQ